MSDMWRLVLGMHWRKMLNQCKAVIPISMKWMNMFVFGKSAQGTANPPVPSMQKCLWNWWCCITGEGKNLLEITTHSSDLYWSSQRHEAGKKGEENSSMISKILTFILTKFIQKSYCGNRYRKMMVNFWLFLNSSYLKRIQHHFLFVEEMIDI